MRGAMLLLEDKLLLNKRGVIESVNDILKNGCHIQHTRHRSPVNFIANIIAGLIDYALLRRRSNQRIASAK